MTSDTTQELQALCEENELLLLQLHQLQEELEHYFAENCRLREAGMLDSSGSASQEASSPAIDAASAIEGYRGSWQLVRRAREINNRAENGNKTLAEIVVADPLFAAQVARAERAEGQIEALQGQLSTLRQDRARQVESQLLDTALTAMMSELKPLLGKQHTEQTEHLTQTRSELVSASSDQLSRLGEQLAQIKSELSGALGSQSFESRLTEIEQAVAVVGTVTSEDLLPELRSLSAVISNQFAEQLAQLKSEFSEALVSQEFESRLTDIEQAVAVVGTATSEDLLPELRSLSAVLPNQFAEQLARLKSEFSEALVSQEFESRLTDIEQAVAVVGTATSEDLLPELRSLSAVLPNQFAEQLVQLKSEFSQALESSDGADMLNQRLDSLESLVRGLLSNSQDAKSERIDALRKNSDRISGDLSAALKLQAIRESDYRELQERFANVNESRIEQESLLIELREKLNAASAYLHNLQDGKLDDAGDGPALDFVRLLASDRQ